MCVCENGMLCHVCDAHRAVRAAVSVTPRPLGDCTIARGRARAGSLPRFAYSLLLSLLLIHFCALSCPPPTHTHTPCSLVLNLNTVLPVLVLLSFIPSLARVPITGADSVFAPCKSASGDCLVVVFNR